MKKIFTLFLSLIVSVGTIFAETVTIGSLTYNLDPETSTAELVSGGDQYLSPISVSDQSVSDWNLLPSQYVFEANCPDGALWTGLRTIKVYADEVYINFMLQFDPDETPKHRSVDVIQIFLNADNNDATGGYSDLFDYPNPGNIDVMFEGSIWDDTGEEISYNPSVSYWSGDPGGEGWKWTEVPTSNKIAESQFVGDNVIEGRLMRPLIPWYEWKDQFSIGFALCQNFNPVGVLPQAVSPGEEMLGRAKKLTVTFNPLDDIQSQPIEGDLEIPSTISHDGVDYTVTSIGGSAFKGCTGLTSVTIPNSITKIGMGAFYKCTALTSVIIPESVTALEIGGTFQECQSLTTVHWNATNCTAVLNDEGNFYPPFYDVSSITEFIFGDNVESIPYKLCCGLSGVASIVIPNSVTSIGTAAFKDCTGLTSITIPENVTTFNNGGTFELCSSLQEVHWNAINAKYDGFVNGSETTYWCIFNGSVNITTFTFGDKVEYIPIFLCTGLSKLTNIVIPKSVATIDFRAFGDCTGLKSVICKAITPPNGQGMFGGVKTSECTLYVPKQSIAIYKTTNNWKDFYKILPIEEAVENVTSNKSGIPKLLQDGQILILNGDNTYTITGKQIK